MKQLTGLDAAFLYMETPTTFGHVTGLMIFDRHGTDYDPYAAVYAKYASLAGQLEPLRRRLLGVPFGFDHPYWVADPNVDLDFHIREIRLARPGMVDQLAEQVSRIVGRPMDRCRPLWEVYVIDGLHSGRWALLTKYHHATIGGAAGQLMLNILTDTEPDAQARRANDGELSAGFQADLTIDQDAVDGLLTAEELAAEFDENLDDGKWYAEYRRLAAEQAALRRLATLVARGVEPSEVFGAVTDEMRRCMPADTAGLWRFESDREITLVAAAADPAALARWPVGTRTPVKGDTIATLVQRSGRPARIDSYDNVAGPIAARVRAVGVRAAVAVPIIVDSCVWGLAAVGSLQDARCQPTPRSTSAASPN